MFSVLVGACSGGLACCSRKPPISPVGPYGSGRGDQPLVNCAPVVVFELSSKKSCRRDLRVATEVPK